MSANKIAVLLSVAGVTWLFFRIAPALIWR